MSLNDGFNAFNINPQQAQRLQPEEQPDQYLPHFNDLASVFSGLMPSGTHDENVSRIRKAIDSVCKESPSLVDRVSVYTLSQSHYAIPGTVIAMTLYTPRGLSGLPTLGVFTILIGSTCQDIGVRTYRTSQGANIEVRPTPVDVYANPGFWVAVRNGIRSITGVNLVDDQIIDAGGLVIPDNFTVDKDNPDTIRPIIVQAAQSLQGVIGSYDETVKRFSVGWCRGKNQLRSKVEFPTTTTLTSTGLPVRNDIVVDVSVTESQNQNQAQMNGFFPSARRACTAGAYVDLVYEDPSANGANGSVQHITQRYVPRVILTSVYSAFGAHSLELYWLGIAAVSVMMQRRRYAEVWFPRHGHVPGQELRDITALGYDYALGLPQNATPQRIALQGQHITSQELSTLLNTMVFANPVFCMDVEDAGDNVWIKHVFSGDYTGDIAARGLIWDSLEAFSANNFSRSLSNSGRGWEGLFLPNATRIHTGYYHHPETNTLRDIRDIDLLALLNLVGVGAAAVVRDWENSFVCEDQILGLNKREQILRTYCPRVTITGYATRYTMRPDVLEAFFNAAVMGGLRLQQDDQGMSALGEPVRGSQNWSGMAVQTSHMNTSGLFYNPQFNSVQPGFSGRFNR